MSNLYVFGYGSLVNRNTHTYGAAAPGRLIGWRRVWRHTMLRPRPMLTIEPCVGVEILGLVARVPNSDWAALDERESAYDRVTDIEIAHASPAAMEIAAYTIPAGKHPRPAQPLPIALSYLDVVVQGYLREFGEAEAHAFFDTTAGWDGPIQNDRAAPFYPRAQTLSARETAFVDAQLRRLGHDV